MEMSWNEIIMNVAVALVGILTTLIGVVGGFYVKRIENKIKNKALIDEVNRYVQWTLTSKTFNLMSGEEKTNILLEQLRAFAIQNEIQVTDIQLILMIENSMKPLMTLSRSGEELLKLKEKSK